MQSVQQVTVVAAYVIFMITIIIILGRYYSLYKVWIEISVFDFDFIMSYIGKLLGFSKTQENFREIISL